jgi:competence protein ComEC
MKISTSIWGLQAFRGYLRTRFREEIETRVSTEQAALANAILLGNREGLDQEARREFMMTGTVHVLAISGLHVGILSVAVYQLLRFLRLPRRWNLLFSIAFVIFYAWLVEFRAPVTRAMILITCVCLSRLWGRSGFSLNVLALAGLVVLAINPADLFSLGSQLSFLAVFTMSMFLSAERTEADPVKRLVLTTRGSVTIWFRKVVNNFITATAVSALIWIVTVPLVARNFHLFAPSGLYVNPVVLLPMTTSLFGGLLTILFSGWFSIGAIFGGWICSQSLAIIQWLVATGSRSSGGHLWTSGPSAFAVVLFYIGFLLICLRNDTIRSRRLLMTWFAAWLGLGWLGPAAWQSWQSARDSETWTMTVIDVGHGSSVLVQLPGDEVLLYDAGSFGSSEAATRAISSVLWSEGIHHIDALVISHADLDHFNGAPQLCERFSIGRVFVPGHFLTAPSPSVEFAREQFRRKGIDIATVWRGLNLKTGSGAKIRVLNPSPYVARGSDNAQSIVLEISACGRTLILPGDLEPPGLQYVLQMESLDADVALLPHHGSMGSDPVSFLGWCRPELAVISGEKLSLNIDESEASPLGSCQVVSTAELGAIRIRFSQDQVDWQSWIADNRKFDRVRFGSSWHLLSRRGHNTDDRIGQIPSTGY